jgi:hypothetical protein
MKTPHQAILATIVLFGLLSGCGPKTVDVNYFVAATEPDTLFVEWMETGSNDWQEAIVPHRFQTNVGVSQAVRLFGFFDIDPDDADSYVPSLHIDSLLVYRFINGEADSLIYEGLDDSDWDLNVENDEKWNSYYLRPI